MLALGLGPSRVRVLAVGAHSDDIEIGAGGTLMTMIEQDRVSELHWLVLSGGGTDRGAEARRSAEAMTATVPRCEIVVHDFPDGFFPYGGAAIKASFESVARDFSPEVIFTHQRNDLHQDHRVCCELTWNTWRNHMVLEYEVPKFDGDMGRPNMFSPVGQEICARKLDHLMAHFGSQRAKHWFTRDLFSGLMRLRGVECNSPTSFAEAFYCPKAVMTCA